MIGQQKLLNNISTIIDRFPKFSIIVGDVGCGKKTICKEIARRLRVTPVYYGIKIDDIRNAINFCYSQVEPIAIIIPDADSMSLGAKNSLLKITEEPPKNVYFILTLQNINNTLETIKSRATVFSLDAYSTEEILQYRVFKGYQADYDNIVAQVCTTTGELDEIFKYDIVDFYNFANCVANNIHVPKSGNAFKISKRLKVKENDSGFSCILLLKAVQRLFLMKAKETNKIQYVNACIETLKSIQQLNINSISKLGIIDMWIINTRRVLQGI